MRDAFKRLFGARPSAATPVSTVPPGRWRSEGNALVAKGDLRGAAQAYARAVEADPADTAARVSLGFALLESGEAAQARGQLRAALESDGGNHDAQFLLARTERALGDLAAARHGFARTIALAPTFELAHLELAQVHARQEDVTGAMRVLQDAAAAHPAFATVRLQLGRLTLEQGDLQSAADWLAQACALHPDVEALSNLAQVLQALGRHDEAADAFARAAQLVPQDADAQLRMANALLAAHREADAVDACRAALQRAPGHTAVRVNLGSALQTLNRHAEAIAAYDEVLAREPRNAAAHWNRALCKLVLGDLGAAWPDMEWRWQALGRERMQLPAPPWTGVEPLAGKTIFLYSEQRLGDTLQFARYVPLLARQGARVLLNVPRALQGLLVGLEGVGAFVHDGDAVPAMDYQLPLLSLPGAMRTTLETIPWTGPYLHADPERVARWRARLAGDDRLRVGLVWSGSATHVNDHNRSIALQQLLGLAMEGVHLIGLQKEVRAADAQVLRDASITSLADELHDFDDTAAVIATLDLLVTVDTSVAHVAGALGAPVCILLPFSPDWRWLLDRTDTPWYPSATLLRQARLRDWSAPLVAARARIQALQRGES